MSSDITLHRPRVSRETRRLLGVAALALACLWALARLRFPEAPATVNPVPPLLAQLATPARFADLAAEVAPAMTHVRPFVTTVALDARRDRMQIALRVGANVALAIEPPDRRAAMTSGDPLTGARLLPTIDTDSAERLRTWEPVRLDEPRYLLAATAAGADVALWPVFVASLTPVPSAIWRVPIWQLPPMPTTPGSGALMFSTAGEFAGAVVEEDGRRAIVPAERFLAVADDLLARRDAPPAGRLGLSIAPLTPALARATGVTFGVVVTDVAQDTGSNDLRAGDIVTAVNDRTVRSLSEWHAATAVIAAGATATLRVTDGVNTRDVVVMAHEPAAARPGLGARFARVAGGSRLLAVEAGTAVDRAGLVTGDLITRAGTISAPTPSQITRLFAEHQNGLLIAFTRGGRHQVTALVP